MEREGAGAEYGAVVVDSGNWLKAVTFEQPHNIGLPLRAGCRIYPEVVEKDPPVPILRIKHEPILMEASPDLLVKYQRKFCPSIRGFDCPEPHALSRLPQKAAFPIKKDIRMHERCICFEPFFLDHIHQVLVRFGAIRAGIEQVFCLAGCQLAKPCRRGELAERDIDPIPFCLIVLAQSAHPIDICAYGFPTVNFQDRISLCARVRDSKALHSWETG